MLNSEATTRGIRIHVQASYVPERSRPEDQEWFFAYRVRITNEGADTAQLVSRHWIITDANGHEEEVKGPGVVGKQPVLGPGETFEYMSFCPLATAFGTMHGTYQMVTVNGERFNAEVAAFTLAEPHAIH